MTISSFDRATGFEINNFIKKYGVHPKRYLPTTAIWDADTVFARVVPYGKQYYIIQQIVQYPGVQWKFVLTPQYQILIFYAPPPR